MRLVLMGLMMSFNPCCDGSCFGIPCTRSRKRIANRVSILVVMEVALELTANSQIFHVGYLSFNPCCDGSCFGMYK